MADLSLRGVTKKFGVVNVIPHVDLDIEDGEFVVLVGPSGCGKSTLLRIISGLEEASGGHVRIGDDDVTYADPSDRGVAMVFQSYALYPHMTVEKNMSFGLRMGGMALDEVAQRVKKAAAILAIEELMQRKPKELSGGQRQRVAIGRAIVREPKVFLFDEPLSNLDAELRVQMRVEIAKLHKQLGATMVYVTHDQVEAMTLADKIVVLRAGRIEQQGSPISLYDDPDTEFVAGFIGSPRMNLIPGEIASVQDNIAQVKLNGFSDDVVPVKLRKSTASVGDKVTFGVRPEHFIPSKDARHTLTARAQVVERLGGVSYIYAIDKNGEPITIQEAGHSHVPADTEVKVGVNPETSVLFDHEGKRC